MEIGVIDAGMGNHGSVANMLRRIGVLPRPVRTAQDVEGCTALILPGVGAFDHGMAKLRGAGLDRALVDAAGDGVPLLGICLGLQLLFDRSEEGHCPGLGLIRGEVVRIRAEHHGLALPHMGWNEVIDTGRSDLLPRAPYPWRFYFANSYVVRPANDAHVAAEFIYGDRMVAGASSGLVEGVQFHPEKSHQFGMAMLRHFAQRCSQ